MSLAPVRLRADNFTPATRTPWGGTRILQHYKAALDVQASGVVGEAWEVSVEPSFPSRTNDGATLASVIAGAPGAWLGERHLATYRQCPLLVKLLDAADNLSVQVHPHDDDPALGAEESGKPESWVVLDAAEGAGLYLGFQDGVTRADVAACLELQGALDDLMTFVPVQPGDAFVIEAGTPHAIGAGVTLLEPQHVSPGRKGLTYRFWDWNRRYDAHGQRDPAGQPRELHVERSLAVTSWDAPRGEAFVATCRASREVLTKGPLTRARVVGWRWFVVDAWTGSGDDTVDIDTLAALTCVAGRVRVTTNDGDITLGCGESGVVPAAAKQMRIETLGDRDAVLYMTAMP